MNYELGTMNLELIRERVVQLLVFLVGFLVVLVDDLAEAEAGEEGDKDAVVIGGGHDRDPPGIGIDGNTAFERLDKGVEFAELKIKAEFSIPPRHEFHFVPSFKEGGPAVYVVGRVQGGGIELHLHDGVGIHRKEIDDLVVDGFIKADARAEGEKIANGHTAFVDLAEEVALETISQPYIEKKVGFAVNESPGVG